MAPVYLVIVVIALVLSVGNYGKIYETTRFNHQLVTSLQDVTTADSNKLHGFIFHAVDDKNVNMVCLKIISDLQGGYLGVYHDELNHVFQIRLATSHDLLHWHYIRTIDQHASQATIAALDNNSFLIGYEKETGKFLSTGYSNLAFKHYANLKTLLSGKSDKSLILEHSFATSNEGTPNFISVSPSPDLSHSIIRIGFHYLNGATDQNAEGTLTNFSAWIAHDNNNINARFDHKGNIGGNIGDRDSFTINKDSYMLIEAQYKQGDFGAWRVYLYDANLGSTTLLRFNTPGHSKAFANPTLTFLFLPNGAFGFVSTEMIWIHNSGPGEAGEMIYYKAL